MVRNFVPFFQFLLVHLCSTYKPVVLIHGIMTGSGSMEMISHRIQEKHPGTKVYNVNRFESWSSLETMWHQVMEIGLDVANISSQYPDGINLIGYSQGGLVARGIVQTFGNVSVSTFISLSSPQAGQYGAGFLHVVFPGLVKESAYELFYSRVGQHTSVGNYWKDPYHQTLYETYSVYLPYINNHIQSAKSDDFKNNMLRLKRLVLIGGPDDQVITPWQSSQFGYYDVNETVVEMREQEIYQWDRIGLRALDESDRLRVVTVPGVNHFNWHMNLQEYYDTNETVVEMREQEIYQWDRIGLRALDESDRLRVVTVPGVNHFNWHMNVSIVDDYLLPYLD